MQDSQSFRAGAGAILYTEDGKVIIFRRSDNVNIWQFQQGGMDGGETPLETLWRELYEETALAPNDFSLVTPYPKLTVYEFPDHIKKNNYRGQVHYWFFLKIKSDTTINLSLARDTEFTEYATIEFSEFMKTSHDFKQSVYNELYTYFEKHISSHSHS